MGSIISDKKLVKLSCTYVTIVVAAFGSGLFDLTVRGSLFELIRNDAPDCGLPPTLGLVPGSFLCNQHFDEDAIILCGPAASFRRLHERLVRVCASTQ